MKKNLFTLLILILSALSTDAAGVIDNNGYYRVRNYGTQRYAYLKDNTGYYDKARTTGDFGAIELWRGQERTISDPASIIYIEKHDTDKYDLKSQGTSVYALIGIYVNITLNSSGAFKGHYTVGGSAYGFDKYLCDQESADVDDGVMGTERDGKYRQWDVYPISAEDDNNYFGITPTIQAGNKYYQPFYADFPFEFYSSGMKAYAVTKVDKEMGLAVWTELTGAIPAQTPVLIECSSADPAKNRLNLILTSPQQQSGNLLKGVFFCNDRRPKSADALTKFNTATMRVPGITTGGKLGLVSNSTNLVTFEDEEGAYLPANQSYLPVSEGTGSELTLVTEAEYQQALANREYTITYMLDGVVYNTQKCKVNATITPVANPTKEGYTFNGWEGLPETMPNNDITVTGSFTINTYKVTYLLDGNEYKTESVVYGGEIPTLPNPEKEGYTFSGWSEAPKTMPANDVTITGSFTINTYKVTYLIDGAEYKTENVAYGAEIPAISNPEKEGYTFNGWSEAPKTMPANDVTITGSFTINTYKVTYLLDGSEYKTESVIYGGEIPTLDNPEKEGYTFSGWSEAPKTMPANDVTITGSFTINSYTITFMVDNVVFHTESVLFGEKIPTISNPEKENFEFIGWEGLPETMPAHDVTVTATFKEVVVDAIHSVQTKRHQKVYNLSGQKVNSTGLRRGLYIINGRKVLIK